MRARRAHRTLPPCEGDEGFRPARGRGNVPPAGGTGEPRLMARRNAAPRGGTGANPPFRQNKLRSTQNRLRRFFAPLHLFFLFPPHPLRWAAAGALFLAERKCAVDGGKETTARPGQGFGRDPSAGGYDGSWARRGTSVRWNDPEKVFRDRPGRTPIVPAVILLPQIGS